MQKFWYHSPVRFYRTIEELEDMTNPQNAQFYGHHNPYPLEYNSYHRYLIPNYQNEVTGNNLKLWLVGDEEKIIPCVPDIRDGKLRAISFISYELGSGRFEIRDDNDTTLYYSNCIEFTDSEDEDGRKFIRIATQCKYNRNLFTYDDGQHDWIVTNLPAYGLGEFDIDEDITAEREGDQASTTILDAWYEENVTYQILSEGDCNILSFISVHSLNQDLYIDGTKRVRKEKPEVGEHSSTITMKFSNVKDERGLNIILNEDDIFDDVMVTVLSNDSKTVVYAVDKNNTAIQVKD